MRPDLPPEIVENLRKLPPDLREAAERAIDQNFPTPESDAEKRRKADHEARLRDAFEHRELAAKAARALEGEWGDDIRRAVDEITREVRASVLLLADWSKRARRREALTKIEWAAARQAFESRPVRYALAAAKKVIADAEKERKRA